MTDKFALVEHTVMRGRKIETDEYTFYVSRVVSTNVRFDYQGTYILTDILVEGGVSDSVHCTVRIKPSGEIQAMRSGLEHPWIEARISERPKSILD